MHRYKIVKFFQIVLLCIIAFPFIPGLFPTDTQPFVVLVFFLYLFTHITFWIPAKYSVVEKNFKHLAISLGLLIISVISISYNSYFLETSSIQRAISFWQFLLCFFIGGILKIHFSQKAIIKILIIYVGFTLIYFITDGFVENILLSRNTNFVNLMDSGRGASTLSPEPSFFAQSVWNLFVIALILFDSKMGERDFIKIVGLTIVCLISSLGGYGFLYAFIILTLYFPILYRRYKYLVIPTALVFGALIGELSFRAFQLITEFWDSGLGIIQADPSIARRIYSFNNYITNFLQHPIIGSGFTYFGGGGIVSLISSLGIVGLIFIIYTITKAILSKHNFRVKLVFLGWFSFIFISGPIAIPAVGFIMGLIIRDDII